MTLEALNRYHHPVTLTAEDRRAIAARAVAAAVRVAARHGIAVTDP